MLYITKLPQRRECPYSGQSLLPTHSLIQSRDKRCRHDLCGSCQKDCPLRFAKKTSKPMVRKFSITAMTDHQQPISLRSLPSIPAHATNTSRNAIERIGSQRDKRFIFVIASFIRINFFRKTSHAPCRRNSCRSACGCPSEFEHFFYNISNSSSHCTFNQKISPSQSILKKSVT